MMANNPDTKSVKDIAVDADEVEADQPSGEASEVRDDVAEDSPAEGTAATEEGSAEGSAATEDGSAEDSPAESNAAAEDGSTEESAVDESATEGSAVQESVVEESAVDESALEEGAVVGDAAGDGVPAAAGQVTLLLVLAWLWVGAPLGYGVYKLITTATHLFVK
jgi:hypothetical protein